MVPWHERESLRFQCVSLALSRSGALGLHRAPPDKEREEDSRQFTENCVMSNRIGDEGLEVDYEAEEVNVWPNKERLSSENWDLCRNKEKLWKGYK